MPVEKVPGVRNTGRAARSGAAWAGVADGVGIEGLCAGEGSDLTGSCGCGHHFFLSLLLSALLCMRIQGLHCLPWRGAGAGGFLLCLLLGVWELLLAGKAAHTLGRTGARSRGLSGRNQLLEAEQALSASGIG